MKSKLLLSDNLSKPTASRSPNSAGAPYPCEPRRRGGRPPRRVPARGIYLHAGVAGLSLGLGAAAAVAPPAPAGGRGGGCGTRAATAAQLGAGPADAGCAGGSRRAARGDGVGGVGLDEEAGQGCRRALRHAGGLAGRAGLVRVPAVDHAALRDMDAGGAAHPSAGLPRAPARARGRRDPAHPLPPAVRGRPRRRPDCAPPGLCVRRSVGLAAVPPAEPPGTARVTPTFPFGPSSSPSGGARTHSAPRAPAAATLPAAAPQTRSPRLRLPLLPRRGPRRRPARPRRAPAPAALGQGARPPARLPAPSFPTFGLRPSPPSLAPTLLPPQVPRLRGRSRPSPTAPLRPSRRSPSSPDRAERARGSAPPRGPCARQLAPRLGALPSSSAVQRPRLFCTHPDAAPSAPAPLPLKGCVSLSLFTNTFSHIPELNTRRPLPKWQGPYSPGPPTAFACLSTHPGSDGETSWFRPLPPAPPPTPKAELDGDPVFRRSPFHVYSSFGSLCQGMGGPAEEGTLEHIRSPKIQGKNRKKLTDGSWLSLPFSPLP